MCIQGMKIILNIVGVTFRIGLDHKVETERREFKFEDAENLNDQDCQFDEWLMFILSSICLAIFEI